MDRWMDELKADGWIGKEGGRAVCLPGKRLLPFKLKCSSSVMPP